jgi:hypothetical protein
VIDGPNHLHLQRAAHVLEFFIKDIKNICRFNGILMSLFAAVINFKFRKILLNVVYFFEFLRKVYWRLLIAVTLGTLCNLHYTAKRSLSSALKVEQWECVIQSE